MVKHGHAPNYYEEMQQNERGINSLSEELSLSTRGYRFLRKLGQGSYAKVYLGEFKTIPDENPTAVPRITQLACKIIDTTKSPKEFLTKFLKREIDILLKVRHPHIIHTHSLFQRKHKYYVFMR